MISFVLMAFVHMVKQHGKNKKEISFTQTKKNDCNTVIYGSIRNGDA